MSSGSDIEEKWQDQVPPFNTPPSESDKKKYFGNALVKTFKEQFSTMSWNSPKFALLSLHVLLGSLPNIRNIKINIGNSFIDCRVHMFLLQESGSGKGPGFSYTGKVCNKLGINFKESGDLTNASLVGSPQPAEDDEDDEDEIIYGLLDPRWDGDNEGNIDILAASEGSQVIDTRTNNYDEKSVKNLQKAINPLGTHDNIVSRDTGATDISISFHSHVSCYFTSYKPNKLFQTITQTGLLQRMLVIYNPISFEDKYDTGMKHANMLESDDVEPIDYGKVVHPLEWINRRYQGVDSLSLTEDAKRILKKQVAPHIYKVLVNLDSDVKAEAQKFSTRYQAHIYRIAWHHAIMRLDDEVGKQDIAYARKIVMPIYKTLIAFLEDEYRVDEQRKMKTKSETNTIRQMYGRMAKESEKEKPWIMKNGLVRNLKEVWDVSRDTARHRLDRHITMFEVGLSEHDSKILRLRE